MKLFLRAALIGSLVFMLLCASAILIGRSNSTQPELFQYLSTCDGQPCYLGIVPGKTSWNDAVTIFEDAPGMQFDPDTDRASNPLGFQGIAIPFPSDQYRTVTQIELSISSPDITIGNLILQMGTPCGIEYAVDGTFTMYYPEISIYVDIDENAMPPLKATSLPVVITLFDEYKSCNQYEELPDSYGFQIWRGFARYAN